MALDTETVAELNKAIDVAVEEAKPIVEDKEKEVVEEKLSEETPVEETPIEETPVEKPVVAENPVVEEKVVAPVRPQLSDAALTRAVRNGLSYSDAVSFPSEAALSRVLDSIEASKKPVEEAQQEEDPFAALPKLDPESYEPEVIKMYDGLVSVIRKQNEQLKVIQANQNVTVRASQESNARNVEKWFDGQVAKLGEDFSESLGTGEYRKLTLGSPQLAKRDAIANQTAILIAGYRAAGVQLPPQDEVFSQAARLVLGKEYESAHEKRLSADLEKRSRQHISRAGGSKGKDKSDPAAAIAEMLDEKYFAKT